MHVLGEVTWAADRNARPYRWAQYLAGLFSPVPNSNAHETGAYDKELLATNAQRLLTKIVDCNA